jgi:hypothetical protein
VKLVQTLVVRGDADAADAQIAFQLNAGVDFVLAIFPETHAAGAAILERYERGGYLRWLREETDADSDSRTRLARLAATEHGADWVINSDAGEFWWPRGESLKDVLAPIPPRYTIVQALRRQLVPQPGADGAFGERLTARRAVEDVPPSTPASLLRPIHRADPEVVVNEDGSVQVSRPVPLRSWYPVEVFETANRDETEGGSLVEDTRLRDALRTLREQATDGSYAVPSAGTGAISFRTPDIVDDAAYAVECAAVGEVDLPRLEEYVTELEQRVGWLEQRFWPRLLRSVSRRVKRPS